MPIGGPRLGQAARGAPEGKFVLPDPRRSDADAVDLATCGLEYRTGRA